MGNVLVCASGHFVLGGGDILLLRDLKWAVEKGYRGVLILAEGGRFDDSLIAQLEDMGVEIYYFYQFWKTGFGKIERDGMPLSFEKSDHVIWISYYYYLFLLSRTYQAIKYRDIDINTIWYIVHPEHTKLSCGRIVNGATKRFVLGSLSNNMRFMDEETRDACVARYGGSISDYKIIRLGLPDIGRIQTRHRNKTLEILTLGRFEFPFKAYVFGVVDAVAKIISEGRDINLTITGYGRDEKELLNYIEQVDSETRKHIHIIGKTRVEDLPALYDKADIYIGCGTTLIEAAQFCVPAISTYCNQYSEKCVGKLVDHPEILALFEGEEGPVSTVSEEIRTIMEMDEVEYIQCALKTRKVYDDYYSIDTHMNQMVGIRNKKDSFLEIVARQILYLWGQFSLKMEIIRNNRSKQK